MLRYWFYRIMTSNGREPWYYHGRLQWWCQGLWIPLTKEEEAEYVSREAW